MKLRATYSVLSVAVLLLVTAGTAAATDRHASPSGSGTACTLATPCSILEAIANATSGDDVFLAPGDYVAASVLYVPPGIDVIGSTDDPTSVSITSNESPRAMEVSDTGTVSGIEIANTNAGASAVWVTQGGQFSNSIARGEPITSGTGCYVFEGAIRDSLCTGRSYALRAGSGAISETITLRNVTAIGGDFGIGLDSSTGSNTIDAKAVIASGTTTDVVATTTGVSDVSTVTLANSSFQTTQTSGPGTSTITPTDTNGNISADPFYVDAPNGNYRPAPGSPTINAGAFDVNSGTLDLDGNPRVQGSAVDIGAYEAEGIAPAAPTISAPTAGLSNLPVSAVAGSAEANSLVSVTINGIAAGVAGASPTGAWNLSLEGSIANGTFTIAATATDAFKNTSAAGQVTVVLDSIAPSLKILAKPKKKSSKRKVRIRFKADETVTFKCKLDRGKFKTCKSPYVKKVKPGAHKLRIVATDAAGNVSKTSTVSWRVKR